MPDIRWKQRFDNYLRALAALKEVVDISVIHSLTHIEEMALIQAFEFTHELAWKVLKDFLQDNGEADILAPKDTTRRAFKYHLIPDNEVWMDMIKSRNETTHSYDLVTAERISRQILTDYYPAFTALAEKLASFYEKEDE